MTMLGYCLVNCRIFKIKQNYIIIFLITRLIKLDFVYLIKAHKTKNKEKSAFRNHGAKAERLKK